MRRILIVDDDVHIAARDTLRVIDQCLSEAEPHRRRAAALGAAAGSHDGTISWNGSREGVLTG